MKILVIQLLRLGDIILSAPVVRGLKDKYPESEVDMLINSQFKNVKPLMPFVNAFIGFDRSKAQRKLKYKDVAYFSAFQGFSDLTDHLKKNQYDLVVNLTHNKMSGYLVELINPKEHLGLKIHKSGNIDFGSQSFKFLNTHGLSKDKFLPHYIDLYLEALKQPNVQRKIVLKETAKGFQEAKLILGTKQLDLLIQPLTSEDKKNWSLENFKLFLTNYRKFNPHHKIGILGAPFEKPILQDWVQGLDNVYLCIASLEGALTLIKKSKLLLTGDTSIKHLAASTNTRVVELSMGSSHFHFTGVYKKDSYIVQAQADCAPCGHSEKCPYVYNLCRDTIRPKFVAELCTAVYYRNEEKIYHLVNHNISTASVHKTFIKNNLGFHALSIKPNVNAMFDSIFKFKNTIRLRALNQEQTINEYFDLIKIHHKDVETLMTVLTDLYQELNVISRRLSAVSLFNEKSTYILRSLVNFYLREHNLTHVEQLASTENSKQFLDLIKEELGSVEYVVLKLMNNKEVQGWTKPKNSQDYLQL